MRLRIRNELILLNLLVFILVAAINLFPSNVLKLILGIPLLLFFPGYALAAALFPRRERMDGIERIALSFGLSIAVVSLIGLILNYTPLGIRLEPVLYSVASFIFVISVIGWFRRRRLTAEERFSIEFQVGVPGWGESRWDKVLSVILVVAIAGALGMLGYALAAPKVGERFTEFYILGLEGKAIDYPREITVGEEGKVIVGIINREHKTVSYRVEVRVDGVKNNEVGAVLLEHDEKWEGEISFVPTVAGDNQKAGFLLYKEGQSEAYQSLHLWVNVTE